MQQHDPTDWEPVEEWYDALVGKKGHYYHRQVILPKLLPILNINKNSSLLDLACGQGILARHLPKSLPYHGIDLSPSLIRSAQKEKLALQHFSVGDICKPLKIKKNDFTHASIILALQNLAAPEKALANVYNHLADDGILVLILNHPCFRIPRQSHWGVDQKQKIQYRRLDRYLTPLKIPILAHPGKSRSDETWSFHYSLSDISHFLADAGFAILLMEEWISDKQSHGKAARMENRARKEFPLFLAIKAKKMPSDKVV